MRFVLTIIGIFFLSYTASHAEPADPKAYLQMIFENKGAYTLSSDETSNIFKEGGHPQYGEIPYDSAAHILQDLNLSKQDVFYDLGCGVGKFVIQAYLTTPVKRSVGIELSPTRWNVAETVLKQIISDDHLTQGRELLFLNQNITKTPLTDATVCFISGIAFPPQLIESIMNRISNLDHDVKVISVMPLPQHKQFHLLKTYNLPMSWYPEGVDVCLYQFSPTQDTSIASQKRTKRKKRVL